VTITIVSFALSGLAILTMLICVIRGIMFYRSIAGGAIKRRVAILVALLLFFFLGYIASPFFYLIEKMEYTSIIVYLVFFFGALFVLLSIDTMYAVLKFFAVVGRDREKRKQ
jgi:hypothetical protein